MCGQKTRAYGMPKVSAWGMSHWTEQKFRRNTELWKGKKKVLITRIAMEAMERYGEIAGGKCESVSTVMSRAELYCSIARSKKLKLVNNNGSYATLQ